MDVLRKNYSTYCSVLYWTGLWPYDQSLLTNIQRVGFSLLLLTIIVVQVLSLKFVEVSVNNVVTALSYTFPLLLYFIRYIGFVYNFPVTKSVFENLENDWKTVRSPAELDMFMKHMAQARRLIAVYLVMSAGVAVFTTITILIPTFLHSKLQLHYLRMYGFFYNEEGQLTDLFSICLVLATVMGLLSTASTEALLAVYAAYFCGLFEITSYRIENAVNNIVMSATPEPINIQPAMEVHKRVIQLVSTFRYFNNNAVYLILILLRLLFTLHPSMVNTLEHRLNGSFSRSVMIPYLVAILAVVVSFAVNLYRLLLATNNVGDVENLLFSVSLVAVHFIIMFLNNYSGQKLKDSSIQVFYNTYNSTWYRIPLKSQKKLLFVLMRSIHEVMYDVGGLYNTCYEGFSMMMSSSFSYFSVLYSIQ